MSTSRILDQIDTALTDWTVGPDAMRCVPSLPVSSEGFAATVRAAAAFGQAMARMRASMQSFGMELAVLTEHVAQLSTLWAGRDEHHPPPLCIDGHAYHRRRNARRRRR